LASKTQAYLAKPVQQKLGSRILRGPPAPALYAQTAGRKGSIETVSVTQLTAPVFNVGCAELAGIDFPKNHHKKIINGQ
jgi:hypothetical protein